MLVKMYGGGERSSPEARYSLAEGIGAKKTPITGAPDPTRVTALENVPPSKVRALKQPFKSPSYTFPKARVPQSPPSALTGGPGGSRT
jgi:hypothetical protein